MTRALSAQDIAAQIQKTIPQAGATSAGTSLVVNKDSLLDVVGLLKNTPELSLDYLVSLTGVDYLDYFEVVYHLVSISHNHGLVLKTRCYGRDLPEVPSVAKFYKGADLQEREVYDLMGIRFTGHPNMRRILLWEEFPGHPLRKDFLIAPQQALNRKDGTTD